MISIHATLVGGDGDAEHIFETKMISIHATLVGGDIATRTTNLETKVFQSTPPSWVATG